MLSVGLDNRLMLSRTGKKVWEFRIKWSEYVIFAHRRSGRMVTKARASKQFFDSVTLLFMDYHHLDFDFDHSLFVSALVVLDQLALVCPESDF